MTRNITGWCERLRRTVGGRYIRTIEDDLARERAENARLRAENHALINSLLGTAGIPPIEIENVRTTGVLPVRRRSWAQIATAREIEAAREARARERESRSGPDPA